MERNIGRVIVQASKEMLVENLAIKIKDLSEQKRSKGGPFSLILSGGSTPKALYEKLSVVIEDWSNIHIFLADERYTPEQIDLQNRQMIKSTLIEKIDIPSKNVNFPEFRDSAAVSAKLYNDLLQNFIESYGKFDVILLGLGSDAHTMSLFPNGKEIYADVMYTSANVDDKVASNRLTGTLKLLSQVDKKVFFVTGKPKETAVNKVFSLESNEEYPATIVESECSDVSWYIDNNINIL